VLHFVYVGHQIPDFPTLEHQPRRHRRSGHAIANGKKCSARIRLLGPRRQRQIRRCRVHSLASLAAAVTVDPVADGAVGRKDNAARLLGIVRSQYPGGSVRRFALTSRNGE